MDEAADMPSWPAEFEEHGYRMIGYAREVCLEFVPDEPDKWVHEFQVEVSRLPIRGLARATDVAGRQRRLGVAGTYDASNSYIKFDVLTSKNVYVLNE